MAGTDATAASTGPASTPVKERYAAGFGRKFFFWTAFLLLLPFFASLPAMFYQRASKGLWFDAAGLVVTSVAFTALMALLLVGLLYSVRAQVVLGDKSVSLSLPLRGGPTPLLKYASHDVPYDQIAAVETRREIYGGTLAPVFMRGARLKTKDGQVISLGYVSEANPDSLFPVPVIAAEIARRAGVPVTDHGSVRRRVSAKVLGIKAEGPANEPVPDEEIAKLNGRHSSAMLALVGALVILLGAGLVRDLMTVDLDRGEQASHSVQEAARPTIKPAPKR